MYPFGSMALSPWELNVPYSFSKRPCIVCETTETCCTLQSAFNRHVWTDERGATSVGVFFFAILFLIRFFSAFLYGDWNEFCVLNTYIYRSNITLDWHLTSTAFE